MEDFTMPMKIDLSFEQVNEILAYDPETGVLTWKVDISRNIKAGTEAGSVKATNKPRKGGSIKAYRYVRMFNLETPAARVAWLLHHGEWPAMNVQFVDDNPLNLRASNLALAKFAALYVERDGRKVRKMPKEQSRHYGLMRYYGMTGEEYGQKLAAQKGLCAICGNPETAMFNGVPKVMHVDHDHATGAIRDLLCGMCNGMLGLAKDNPQVLIAAAEYLQRHSASNVVPLKALEESA